MAKFLISGTLRQYFCNQTVEADDIDAAKSKLEAAAFDLEWADDLTAQEIKED